MPHDFNVLFIDTCVWLSGKISTRTLRISKELLKVVDVVENELVNGLSELLLLRGACSKRCKSTPCASILANFDES